MSRDERVRSALEGAWKDSVRTDPGEQARHVYGALGGRLAAASLGLKDTRTLQSWARGGAIKSLDHERRLQLLYRVTTAVERVYSSSVAAAFLRGSNPRLDDRAPMLFIAEGPGPEGEAEVLAAVEALLES